MAYTVKQISELSGVTVRTLHFYEEAELLKPAYYGTNGYRYYEEKELLKLQQILFFKELGLTLKQIRKVLGQSGFNTLAALNSHKSALSRDWERKGRLIETIDRTIKHFNGLKKMKDREFFDGFDLVKRGKGSETYFAAETIVLENLRNPGQELPALEREMIAKEGNALSSKVADCMEKGLEPASQEVQRLIRKHHAFAEKFHIATKQVYNALAKLYQEHPVFRKQLIAIHLKLPEFMAQAMETFAATL